MVISKRQYEQHKLARAWAQAQAKEHAGECKIRKCGGRQDVWWLARHPQASPTIVTDAVRETLCTTMHVCPLLLARLGAGRVPWLGAAERKVYARRSRDEVNRLLGKSVPSRVPENRSPEENIFQDGASAHKSMPRTRKPAAYQRAPAVPTPDGATYADIIARLSGGR